MALKDILKVDRKTFFNPGGWLGYNALKGQTTYLYGLLKQVFRPEIPTRTESFQEAMARFKVNENDVEELKTNFILYSYVLFGLAVITLCVSIYLLFSHNTFAGFILGVGATALLLTQAFRYSFWAFQIKHRKLGCTFEEWKRGKTYEEEVETKE